MEGTEDECRWSTPSPPSLTATRQSESTLTPECVLKLDSEAAPVSEKKKLACGFMCQGNNGGRACRKQVSKHNRGAVCPDCMDSKEYLQCSNGCLAYVHIGCIENGDRSWVCLECKNKQPDQTETVEAAAEPQDSAVDAEAQDYQIFDNLEACHAHLRLRKFRIQNTFRNAQSVVTSMKYSCQCSAHFIVRHCHETGNWQVPIGPDHMVGTSFHIIIAVITDPYLS